MTLITAETVERAQGELIVAKGDVITPLARDRAAELGIMIRQGDAATKVSGYPRPASAAPSVANAP